MESRPAILITCEHGGNRVPRRYASLFRGQGRRLVSHEGFDPGALDTARLLALRLHAPLVYSTTTRLLVDLNRTERSGTRFSDLTRSLPEAELGEILRRHYQPHWDRVWTEIETARTRSEQVLHIASHSFTPIWRGRERRCDVGLLFDPRRTPEAGFARTWQLRLQRAEPELVVRRNYPYRGWTDGMTRELRRRFTPSQYLGIELEVNQRHLRARKRWRRLQTALVESLRELLPQQRSRERR
jgi:predicted N-formylglutamate amidohydrolase